MDNNKNTTNYLAYDDDGNPLTVEDLLTTDHSRPKKILFVASEVNPFSPSGGMGQVAESLPKAFAQMGHDVTVISPWYRSIPKEFEPTWIGETEIPFDGGSAYVDIGEHKSIDGVKYAFVGHPLFKRDNMYGYQDDPKRFALFDRAIPQVAEKIGFMPDIIHLQDWQAGYLPIIMQQSIYIPEEFAKAKTVYNIHNALYQSPWNVHDVVKWLRLPSELAEEGSEFNHNWDANPVLSGIANSDATIAVSPSYARSLLDPDPIKNHGLELTPYAHKISGIVNGLDEFWNPAHDPNIPKTFTADDMSGKAASKDKLYDFFKLEDKSRPVAVMMGRIVDYKGVDIIADTLDELVAQGWNIAISGYGQGEFEQKIIEAAAKYPGKVAFNHGWIQPPLTNQVYAGADAVLMTSRFEPCGTPQLQGQRYGSLPIVHAVDGLADTVTDGINGFSFAPLNNENFIATMQRAIDTFGTPEWDKMVHTAMTQDISWDKSAGKYDALFENLLRMRDKQEQEKVTVPELENLVDASTITANMEQEQKQTKSVA